MVSHEGPMDEGGWLPLLRWRASLKPLTVDMVGDFAGEELFAIHGEALLVHCIGAARVDYDYGFQLLHAVHAIESFLSKLSDRGCNFHIIWFDSHKNLCVPYDTPDDEAYKYLLTRAVIIQHFACVAGTTFSYRFNSVHDDGFRDYLTQTTLHLFMGSDGRASKSDHHPTTLGHLSIGYRMVRTGYCVAFIDDIEFRSSKVNRSFPQEGHGLKGSHHEVIAELGQAAADIIDIWVRESTPSVKWDAFDLIDGRLYLRIFKHLRSLSVDQDVAQDVGVLAELLKTLSGVDISKKLPRQKKSQKKQSKLERDEFQVNDPKESSYVSPTVLPFNHSVMDQYLQQVHLTLGEDSEEQSSSQIFRELTHWHNTKKLVESRRPVTKRVGFFADRRNKKFMADTIAYSASLTGSSGKIINPEIIVVHQSDDIKRPKTTPEPRNDWRTTLREKQAAKNKKHQQKSGRQKALEMAQALKENKVEEKSAAVVTSWKKWTLELEKEKSLTKRYLKAEKYFRDLSPLHASFVGAETSLYLCHILNMMRNSNDLPKSSVSGITAMLWSQLIETNRLPLTPDVSKQLATLAKILSIPLMIKPASSLTSRALPFTVNGANSSSTELSRPWEFQLEHCGPYMERSFDSAPDPRVPFHPDAWQRKVLDAIDADKSLFVVAPTSSGKTFISFYAMKKVLQANDDDILVYVAPTKALVNQIAAEVQARFSKSYRHDGRSVWAIHTRDYRVNNPNGCQVLVTVPHILQIMLLAPSNAKGPNSWSRRVKRIIFDEVHCIGQSEDGVIWEQLLLLAPCPIIALSATVGNPDEFKGWLSDTQKAKGFDLEMITHGSRYSDLRKFVYEPPKLLNFQGLGRVERLPLPGLDSGSNQSERFTFIHPVWSLVRKDLTSLEDTSFEPRDCLTLWRSMQKHSNKGSEVPETLHPENCLPEIISKADVVEWERALKQQLGAWMLHSPSPFDAVREELGALARNKTESIQSQGNPIASPKASRPSEEPSPYFSLVLDLRSSGALPAIVFSFDRMHCESVATDLLDNLERAEDLYREGSEWKAKMAEFEKWKKANSKIQAKSAKQASKRQSKESEGLNKFELLREKATQEDSPWKSFNPDDPIVEFSLADNTKISKEELDKRVDTLEGHAIKPRVIKALHRGIGVHHAGMNRQYRQIVEILFRKGYLTIVIATGTLALGINMPCKTVVFSGDSPYLTALQYRQASGRAGRRGFDVLGNVVFHDIPHQRALEIMSSKLPKLRGQFPTSVTLVLRLFGLLHGTNNSDYACDAVKSLLSQNRLYLGGPKTKLTLEHHLRFSIEYLRRQHLLSRDGVPLNFAGLVGHLYYTENAAFAFHSLLKEGYFHEVCCKISNKAKQKGILLNLLLVLCHLFCRIPCRRYDDETWLKKVVKPSPSVVILPKLPATAAKILESHNMETLQIFQGYVSTYVAQHLSRVPDNQLPFTKHKVEPLEPRDMREILSPLPATIRASPFAALSGFTDEFKTIGELCRHVRGGVFLEESAIPYIPVAGAELGGVPWNAYIYDFFKHGDLEALIRDNGIKRGDVWFRLKDISLIVATIVTSLSNFLNPDADGDDAGMIDVQDAGDVADESADVDGAEQKEHDAAARDPAASRTDETVDSRKGKGKKEAVMESRQDDGLHDEDELDGCPVGDDKPQPKLSSHNGAEKATTPSWMKDGNGESLVKVYKAFTILQEEFDTKFKKIWA
ncbi:hypothetical protein DL764_008518 [Monosporascus ibericus]|uniref:Helicase ATP-binding domain-containing protein n=1 Tax=Monosporascus ibericus TaxID=155417 RepID=A0A4Q4T035_9PEZI|nr:hypothetical protein DL764_008518 [Monosporascus ibericus]